MRIMQYRDSDLRPGAKIIRPRFGTGTDEVLNVEHVVYRPGRGLDVMTRREDGYAGPTFTPHPDEPVNVLYMPPLSDADEAYERACGSDYPWAEIMR